MRNGCRPPAAGLLHCLQWEVWPDHVQPADPPHEGAPGQATNHLGPVKQALHPRGWGQACPGLSPRSTGTCLLSKGEEEGAPSSSFSYGPLVALGNPERGWQVAPGPGFSSQAVPATLSLLPRTQPPI